MCDDTLFQSQVSKRNTNFSNCEVSNRINTIINQSLCSWILAEAQRCCISSEDLVIDESLQTPTSDWQIYLLLLSLEHARLSSASTPHNEVIPVENPFESMADTPCYQGKPANVPERSMSDYSSLQLLTKSDILKALHNLQESHPYTEFFYHAPSQCMLLVAHTGYDGTRMHMFCECSHCHTNVGFQKFLKYIAEPHCKCLNSGITEERCSDTCDGNDSFSQCFEDEQTETIVGYNTGDLLLHLQSSRFTFFTSDGVQVRVDKQGFVESSISIHVSLLTAEGHKISCVKSDHFECGLYEQFEGGSTNHIQINQPPKGLNHMSFFASLSNGIKVATSYYGPNGNGCLLNMPTMNSKILSPEPLSISHQISSQKTGRKKDLQQNVADMEILEGAEMEVHNAEKKYEQECRSLANHNKYQHLFATTLCGLKLHTHIFSPENSKSDISDEGRMILVKQEYCKTAEKTSDQGIYERYRYYLPGGLLVYSMNDESIIIHTANGSIYRTAMDCERNHYYSQRSLHPTGKKLRDTFQEVEGRIRSASEATGLNSRQLWVITLPSGQRYLWKQRSYEHEEDESEDDWYGLPVPLEDVPCFISSDPVTKQVSCSVHSIYMVM